jgi:hypothetical protein
VRSIDLTRAATSPDDRSIRKANVLWYRVMVRQGGTRGRSVPSIELQPQLPRAVVPEKSPLADVPEREYLSPPCLTGADGFQGHAGQILAVIVFRKAALPRWKDSIEIAPSRCNQSRLPSSPQILSSLHRELILQSEKKADLGADFLHSLGVILPYCFDYLRKYRLHQRPNAICCGKVG